MERRDETVPSERRQGPPRDICRIAAIVSADGGTRLPCVIVDISPSGAKLSLDASCEVPAAFDLVIPIDEDLEETRPCESRWRDGALLGVKFL